MSAEAIPRNDSNDQANAYIHGSVIRNHVPFEATREEKKMKGNVRRRGGISQEIRYSKLVSARVRLSYFLSVNDSFHPNYVRRNVFTLPFLPSFLPSRNTFLTDGSEKRTKEIGRQSCLDFGSRGKITRPTIEEGASSSQNR